MRKPGSVGGGGGSNSNAFINPEFPDLITLFIRQPPHVFGTGYTQQLATEITTELAIWRGAARILAQQTPGQAVELPLTSKGMSFGKFKNTNCSPGEAGGGARLRRPLHRGDARRHHLRRDRLHRRPEPGDGCGLRPDRAPLPVEGDWSSVRHFARDALDFHLSMQAVEKYGDLDCDQDGKRSEVSLGNVSALVSFVTMTRPPQQLLPEGRAARRSVALGKEISRAGPRTRWSRPA